MTPSWPSVADKFLDKVPSEKLYADLFQPGLKMAGQTLETVMDFGNTLLSPVKWLNEASRMCLMDNLKRYEAKLQAAGKETIQVPPIIGVPIIEKLSYLNQEELTEAFINLLTKASFPDTIHQVHPSFTSILSNLSSDEAKILFFIKDSPMVPFINLIFNKVEDGISTVQLSYNLTGLEKHLDLQYPENMSMYLTHLEHVGFLLFDKGIKANIFPEKLDELIKIYYEDTLDENKKNLGALSDDTLNVSKHLMHLTEYGNFFTKACMNGI